MITRRQFLKLAGFGAALGLSPLPWLPEAPSHYSARLLYPVQVAGQALLPDSVHPIQAVGRGRLRIPAAWLPERSLQPMLPPYAHSWAPLPPWVEVLAPYAAIRGYCQVTAPLVQRLGHGGVLAVQGQLEGWLQVSLGDGRQGWVQKTQVQAALPPHSPRASHALLEDTHLYLYQGDSLLLQTPVLRPEGLAAGIYGLSERHPHTTGQAPWLLRFADSPLTLHGVTDHHDFDRHVPGDSLQVPVIAAKALYSLLPTGAYLHVR